VLMNDCPDNNPFHAVPDALLIEGCYDMSPDGCVIGAHGAGNLIKNGGWTRYIGEMKPPCIPHGQGILFTNYVENAIYEAFQEGFGRKVSTCRRFDFFS
jgi:hypothetical protein